MSRQEASTAPILEINEHYSKASQNIASNAQDINCTLQYSCRQLFLGGVPLTTALRFYSNIINSDHYPIKRSLTTHKHAGV